MASDAVPDGSRELIHAFKFTSERTKKKHAYLQWLFNWYNQMITGYRFRSVLMLFRSCILQKGVM
jgi:hypothetical protein